jgi:hypothetical protein
MNHCQWDFAAKALTIQNQKFALAGRPGRRFITKIYVAETVNVEPNTHKIVPVRLAIHSLRTPVANWMIEAATLSKGLYSAQTMLSDAEAQQKMGIAVVNLTARPKSI